MKSGIIALLFLFFFGSAFALPMINGNITFAGGVTLDNYKSTATQVTSWLNSTVESVSGDFSPLVSTGDSVTFTAPWTFGSGLNSLWSVGGFTFNLLSSSIVLQNSDYLLVSGTGIIVDTLGAYANTSGNFRFSIPGDSANGIFSFAAASKSDPGTVSVPDMGSSLALLAIGLAGLLAIRRKVA